jgi:hypothetical protein
LLKPRRGRHLEILVPEFERDVHEADEHRHLKQRTNDRCKRFSRIDAEDCDSDGNGEKTASSLLPLWFPPTDLSMELNALTPFRFRTCNLNPSFPLS